MAPILDDGSISGNENPDAPQANSDGKSSEGKSDPTLTQSDIKGVDHDDDDDVGDISDDDENDGDKQTSSKNESAAGTDVKENIAAKSTPQTTANNDDDIGDISDDDNGKSPEKSPSKTSKSPDHDVGNISDDAGEADQIDRVRNDPKNRTKDVFDSDDDDIGAATAAPEAEQLEPEVVDDVEVPMNELHMGDDISLARLPNFLSIERNAFDPETYTYSKDATESLLDELGRTRVKLQVTNTIRWRYAVDDAGEKIRNARGELAKESNANIVRWSDGSETLMLGDQVVGVMRKDIRSENNCLFVVRDDIVNRAVATIDSKITFKPTSTKSDFHKQLTRTAAVTAERQKKRIVVLAGNKENPEVASANQRKKIEEANRERKTREAKQQRMRERHTTDGPMSREFLDQDMDDDRDISEEDSDLSEEDSEDDRDSKKKRKAGRRIDDDDDDDKKDSSPVEKSAAKKRRFIEDDDGDSE